MNACDYLINLANLFLILGCIVGGIAVLFLILEIVYSHHPKNKRLFIILFSLFLIATLALFILFVIYKFVYKNLKQADLLMLYPNYNSTDLATQQTCTSPYVCPSQVSLQVQYVPVAKNFPDQVIEALTYIKNNNYQILKYDTSTSKYYCYKLEYPANTTKKGIMTIALDSSQLWISKDIAGLHSLPPSPKPPPPNSP